MKYQYNRERESDPYPVTMGVERWFSSSVDENGRFDVPEDHPKIDEIEDRLQELGHEPVGGNDNSGSESNTDAGVGDDSEEATLPDSLTEDDVVNAEYRELQQLAGPFDDIKGNASQGELEEALITKLREREGE